MDAKANGNIALHPHLDITSVALLDNKLNFGDRPVYGFSIYEHQAKGSSHSVNELFLFGSLDHGDASEMQKYVYQVII